MKEFEHAHIRRSRPHQIVSALAQRVNEVRKARTTVTFSLHDTVISNSLSHAVDNLLEAARLQCTHFEAVLRHDDRACQYGTGQHPD